MKNETIKQSVIEKLILIANGGEAVQVTRDEAEYLGISFINDESVIEDKETENE